jgi:hypothetical protein
MHRSSVLDTVRSHRTHRTRTPEAEGVVPFVIELDLLPHGRE